MKVLMTEIFLPESTYTLELGRELSKYVNLTVFCKKSANVSLQNLNPDNRIKWKNKFYAGGKGKIQAVWEYGRGLLALEKEIRCGKYDVVHVQSFKDAAFEIPIYCRAKKHCRMLVHTVHNFLPHEAKEADKKLYSDFYHTCDLLIVHNEYCRKLLMEKFDIEEKKIRVIPHGSYTLPVYKTNESILKKDKTHKTTFLQFGIIRKYKGVDILLKSISMIPWDKRKNMQFIIAGAQLPKLDNTDYNAMIKEYGIGDCVKLRTGHVPDEEVSRLFAEADFCLFPYRDIYGSGALLMAYTYGKPVIASDIPAFREETDNGNTGYLFESENTEALKEAVLHAEKWSTEEYRACQKRISRLVHDKYNWSSSAKLLWEAYQK